MVKAFSLIVWYFLSNYFIKQRKVTTVIKLMRWYYAELVIWLACYAAQTFYSCRYLIIMLKHQEAPPAGQSPYTAEEEDEDWTAFMTIFGALVFLLFLVFTGLSALFLFKLSSYNQGMIDFHKFINSYRQTPRSRNLKKYKPPQEPIYEEMSAFERSHFGSVQVTDDMGSSFHGTHSHRNLIPSSHNDTRDVMSVNNVTMSAHGAHQSAIEYNEQLDRFEEVPVDADGQYFRGSFPNEEMGGPHGGYDIPDSVQPFQAKGTLSSKQSNHMKASRTGQGTLRGGEGARNRSLSKGTDVLHSISQDVEAGANSRDGGANNSNRSNKKSNVYNLTQATQGSEGGERGDPPEVSHSQSPPVDRNFEPDPKETGKWQ